MKVSLCIPMYNESKILPTTLRKVSEYMAKTFDDYEVIFSNDGSTDNSADLVKSFGDPKIKLAGYEKNRGKGCAVRTGILASDGDIVIFTDCDLAYELDVVKRISDIFESNPETDIVLGSRAVAKDGYEGYSFIRKLASKTYVKVLTVIGGLKYSDSQTGCKGFRRETADKIFSNCEIDGFAFDLEVILLAQKIKSNVIEMPVKIINQDESKVNVVKDAIKMIKDMRVIKKRIKHLDIK